MKLPDESPRVEGAIVETIDQIRRSRKRHDDGHTVTVDETFGWVGDAFGTHVGEAARAAFAETRQEGPTIRAALTTYQASRERLIAFRQSKGWPTET